jgi:hypothetical protein
MSNIGFFGAAITFACMTIRYSQEDAAFSSYFRATITAILLTLLGLVFNARLIYPFFTSPLRAIPLIKVCDFQKQPDTMLIREAKILERVFGSDTALNRRGGSE